MRDVLNYAAHICDQCGAEWLGRVAQSIPQWTWREQRICPACKKPATFDVEYRDPVTGEVLESSAEHEPAE